MSSLIEFLKRLFGGRRPDPTLVLNPFPPLDMDAVRQATRLDATAKADGFREFPPSDAVQESATERAIRANCEQERNRYLVNFDKAKRAYVTRVQGISSALSAAGINRVEQNLVNNVLDVARGSKGPIDASASMLKNLADQLRNFRAENDLLGRLPKYHDKWISLFFLLLVFSVEVAITTILLRESSGLLMVIIIAAMYCFLNCLAPFFAVQPIRWTNYRRPGTALHKALGWLAIPLLFALGAALNLLVGHYRSEALKMTELNFRQLDLELLQEIANRVNEIGATALREFVESPFGIDDTWSWLLAIAGFVAFLLSLREGYARNDVYPGYGELARTYHEQLEAYSEEERDAISLLKKERDRGVKGINDEKQKLIDQLQQAPRLLQEIRSLEIRYENALRTLNSDYQSLIEEYRQTNRDTRSTPEPTYFRDIPKLDEAPIDGIDIPTLDGIDQQKLIDTMETFSQRLQEEFDRLVKEVRTSAEVIDGRDPLAIAGGS